MLHLGKDNFCSRDEASLDGRSQESRYSADIEDIRAQMAMMKSALETSKQENLHLKNEINRMQNDLSAPKAAPLSSSGVSAAVAMNSTWHNSRYSNSFRGQRSWGKSTLELGEEPPSRPARKPSPKKQQQQHIDSNISSSVYSSQGVIYLEDDEEMEASYGGSNRRYAERPDSRSSLSMADLCGDDTHSRRGRKSLQKDQCSGNVRSLLEYVEGPQQLAPPPAAFAKTKSLAELGGDSSYVYTRRPVDTAQGRHGERLAHLLHTQHDFVDQRQEQQMLEQEDLLLRQQQRLSRAVKNSPFANEVTSAQFNSVYEPLERQLTLSVAEHTSLTEEVERLRERGLKTLREIARVQFIDARLEELKADIFQLRKALADKPE